MSLFVQKHYGSSRAGLFNFLIQVAIILRAVISAIANFFKRISIALIDALVMLMSFGIAKFIWSNYIRKAITYSPNMLLVAFPIFSIIFLAVSYYTGLYDKKGYKQSQLNQSTIAATMVLLSIYALLPESLRFSRGILVLGIGVSFILISIARWMLVKTKLIYPLEGDDEYKQTIVVAGEMDFNNISTLMKKSGMQERLLGCVHDEVSANSIGNIHQLTALIQLYGIKEIIFCKNGLSYQLIIDIIQKLPGHLRFRYHASGSNSIIGSDSKDVGGDCISADKKYTINTPKNKRSKRLLDMAVSMFFLLTFPVHFILQKKPLRFFKNTFSVLFLKKTWIGYASNNKQLPVLKKPVITITTLPVKLNTLSEDVLFKGDEWYALVFSIAIDIEKIKRGYKYLCY